MMGQKKKAMQLLGEVLVLHMFHKISSEPNYLDHKIAIVCHQCDRIIWEAPMR